MAKIFLSLLCAVAVYGVEGLLIPFYHFPTPNDSKVAKLIAYKKAYPHIKFLVIINPNNGDFSQIQSNFASMIKALADANITVLGYIYSSYAKREFFTLQKRVDAWKQYKKWGVQGIFVDEVSTDMQKYPYYQKLSSYIKHHFSLVVFNPGTSIDEKFGEIADIIVIKEHFKSAKNSTQIKNSAILLYAIKNFEKIKQDLATYHYIYVTEQSGSNPWESISSYMPELLKFIQQKKVPLQ